METNDGLVKEYCFRDVHLTVNVTHKGSELVVKIFKLLEDKANKVPGAKVEHNKFCVSVHFRCVKEEVSNHSLSFAVCFYYSNYILMMTLAL